VGDQKSCQSFQVCEDKVNEDGSTWADTSGGYSCTAGYGGDPTEHCALYGGDVDRSGLSGLEACCVCGGGICVGAAPEEPIIRQSLMELYNSTGGSDWNAKAHWGSELSYCKWQGLVCKSGHVTSM
jgi:hypothetical protein